MFMPVSDLDETEEFKTDYMQYMCGIWTKENNS